jgi:predicted nucleotidyltransferase
LRLSAEAINVIQDAFLRVFETGDLYLFGSRVDDNRKGGDIDLYIVVDNQHRMGEKRIEFLTKIKHKIGDQRIDLVINRGTKRPIDRIATSGRDIVMSTALKPIFESLDGLFVSCDIDYTLLKEQVLNEAWLKDYSNGC